MAKQSTLHPDNVRLRAVLDARSDNAKDDAYKLCSLPANFSAKDLERFFDGGYKRLPHPFFFIDRSATARTYEFEQLGFWTLLQIF